MNILYTSYFRIGKGGAEESLSKLIVETSKNNNVIVASTEIFNGEKTILFKKYRFLPNFYLQSKYLERFLIKSIKKHNINVIHANDRLTIIGAIKAAKKTGIPIVIHFRDYWFCCPKSSCYNQEGKNCDICSYSKLRKCSGLKRIIWDSYKLYYIKKQWKLLNKANIKIAISSTVKEKLDRCLIKNSLVIPNSIEGSRNIVKTFKKNKLQILYLGKLEPSKGIQNILNLLDYKKVEFIVAGYGSLEPLVKKSPAKFLGWVKDTNDLFNKADILIIPSLWEEPFGRVAIEAMSYGIPVIASDIGGIKDIVINNKTGFLVKANNLSQWKEKIEILVKSPKLREQMGQNALIAVKKYESEHIAKKIEDLYKKCVE